MSFTYRVVLLLVLTTPAFAQDPDRPQPDADRPRDVRLPNGKLQRDEMVKADHAKNLEDAQALLKLTEELKAEMEKNSEFVFSIGAVKKTEEIEKIARRIRGRMKRY